MRAVYLLFMFALTAGCAGAPSTADTAPVADARFVDTDGDGLPDARADGAGVEPGDGAEFADADGDGLPDARVPRPDRD